MKLRLMKIRRLEGRLRPNENLTRLNVSGVTILCWPSTQPLSRGWLLNSELIFQAGVIARPPLQWFFMWLWRSSSEATMSAHFSRWSIDIASSNRPLPSLLCAKSVNSFFLVSNLQTTANTLWLMSAKAGIVHRNDLRKHKGLKQLLCATREAQDRKELVAANGLGISKMSDIIWSRKQLPDLERCAWRKVWLVSLPFFRKEKTSRIKRPAFFEKEQTSARGECIGFLVSP